MVIGELSPHKKKEKKGGNSTINGEERDINST